MVEVDCLQGGRRAYQTHKGSPEEKVILQRVMLNHTHLPVGPLLHRKGSLPRFSFCPSM